MLQFMGKETEATTWTTSKFGVTGLSQKREISVTEDDPLPLRTVHAVFEDTCLKYGENLALAQRITLAPPVNPAELDQDAENVATRDLKWRRFTWNEYRDDCRTFAKALVHSDIEPKEVVNILGSNSPQWVIANLGSMLAGCIPAGIYLSNHSESCLQCSNATRSAALIVEGNDQLAKYIDKLNTTSIRLIVVWGETIDQGYFEQAMKTGRQKNKHFMILSWDEFMLLGDDESGQITNTLNHRAEEITPDCCASIVYTSGTTGPPKAVMLSHDNLMWSAKSVLSYMHFTTNDSIVSFLPLNHIAAQMGDIYYPLVTGYATYFGPPSKLGTPSNQHLLTTLRVVTPTIFFAMPRVWEKISHALDEKESELSGLRKVIFNWAQSLGVQRHDRGSELAGTEHAADDKPLGYWLARTLVFNDIKKHLGLQRTRYCAVGAAAVDPELLRSLAGKGLHVYQLYGQTECSGLHTISLKHSWKSGTSGRPLLDSISKIDPANHELCYKGRHVFMGYLNMPAETAAAFDEQGFFHSGDFAGFDTCDGRLLSVTERGEGHTWPEQVGFLKITGRIKELIVTSGGENIPAGLVTKELKAEMPALADVMVIGDKRNFLTVLVSLQEVPEEGGSKGIYLSNHSESCLQCSNATKSAALIVEAADEKTDLGSSSSEPLASASATTGSTAAVVSPPPQKNTASMTPEASEEWSTGKGEGEGEGAGARLSVVALKEGEKVNTTARSYEAAKSDPAWKRYIDEGIDRHNRLHAASHAQKIQKWAFLPSALTEEAGELTALGKIKRNFVLDKYAGLINDLYREEESSNTQMSGSTSCPAVVVTPTRK